MLDIFFVWSYGLLDLSFWGYVLTAFIMVQISMMGVTLYLHRDQAHNAIRLNSALRYFFRIWIYMASGMQTSEWVAVHRKHHALCEKPGDPHSPVVFGLKKVLLEGAELYRKETENPETLKKYSRGTPDDALEHFIRRFPNLGIISMVLLDLFLFGAPGIIIIAVQMSSMPLFAAGGINGLGHHSGYRNFESDDASTNLTPVALLIGGEELHNNHHAFPTAAKFSFRWWEFDIGWMYIVIFRFLGLCTVRRLAPKPQLAEEPRLVDIETLQAVLINRMNVLRDYTRQVTLPVLRCERRAHSEDSLLRSARRLLVSRPARLDALGRGSLSQLLDENQSLRTVHEYRERLMELWGQAHVSNERLVADLKDWCARAEASGIEVLEEFAAHLRGYVMQPVR
jgi:stearoyl-CoA desaturase (delta-9 desaturase)